MSGTSNLHAGSTAAKAGAAEAPCGCREGAVATFVALGLLLLQAAGALDLPLVGTGPWAWLGLIFGAALCGKISGIAVATVLQRQRDARQEGASR